MTTIDILIDDTEVKQLLAQLQQRMTSLKPVMAEIGEIVMESVQRNFEEHRSPDGTAWQPVSDRYAKWKRKKGKSPSNILSLKGDLLHSIKPHPGEASVEVATGPHIVYAGIHQFGGRTGRKGGGTMPPRPYMGIRDDDWREIEDAVQDYLSRVTA